MAAHAPIDIGSDQLRVRILPQGAALVGVRFAGTPRNLVLGFANPSDHANVPIYAGALVGPVANRVRGGLVHLGGTIHQMPCNENSITALHSGPDGLHAQLWRVAEYAQDFVTLTCTLPDGLGGLPGTRHFSARYQVAGSTLSLTIMARTDKQTPINVAAHPYWNLDGHSDVSRHKLEVFADHYLPTDPQNLPTGARTPVTNTLFDFSTPAAVPLDHALDVNFCLADHMRDAPAPAARLTGSNGTTLTIDTTAPGLQVYNGAFLPPNAPATLDGPDVAPYSGVALEPQHWPDAPNHADFPQITLLPNDNYHQVTRYHLQQG